jgi:hypothetical protein
VNLVVSFDTYRDAMDFAAEAQEASRWRYDVEERERAAELAAAAHEPAELAPVEEPAGYDVFTLMANANADARRIECEQGPA